jgi:aminoglycoside phosphotransferase (APT) family kinase protein
LVHGLIASQFPQLELGALGLLGEGWDNSVWVVEDRWVFRFPRRAVAVAGVEREIAVLPRLAPLMTLPIPSPVFIGRPADGYPWPLFGCRLIRGCEVVHADLSDATRRRLAGALGSFLHDLHSSELAARVDPRSDLPVDPTGRTDMRRRVPLTQARLEDGERRGLWNVPSSVGRCLEAARRCPPAVASSVVHGDLHARHVLVDADGAATGVIDWGDLCLADPAIDLSLLWSLLPIDARSEFLDAYGPARPEQLLRARVLALFLCAALALYADHEQMPRLEHEAISGLARAWAD